MSVAQAFEPDWVSPPGATVLDLLEERGFTAGDFARAIHRTTQEVSRLLYGAERLDRSWAEQLAGALGGSPDFWLRREEQYRRDVERLYDSSEPEAAIAWLEEMPVGDMVRFGWLPKASSRAESLSNTLAFFGVPSINAWRHHYRVAIESAAYRTSRAYETRPGAVAAWLRQGELVARELDCSAWNPRQFLDTLPQLRSLSRDPNPATFLPALVELCRQCGVAVVIERAPSGCRASGATKFLSPKKALMLLSFRHLSDDQFWFTVFHEAGHLLLHAQDGLFLEGIEMANSGAEDEADEFARLNLFTEVGLRELQSLPLNHFAIARFAKRLGLAAGLVVGQLQNMKRVPYGHFNYLKARYSWRDE